MTEVQDATDVEMSKLTDMITNGEPSAQYDYIYNFSGYYFIIKE